MNNSNYVDLEKVIGQRLPLKKSFTRKFALYLLAKIFRLAKINDFISRKGDFRNFDFIDEIFDEFKVNYRISQKDKEKIPAEGSLICVANHPLGGLDGLILLKAISEVRNDVLIVVNDVLMSIENLKDLFIPVDIFNPNKSRAELIAIRKALEADKVVVFFPSAEVSRFSFKGLRDVKWHNGPVYFANKCEVPVLPLFIKGRNSVLFYLVSFLSKKLSMFLLPGEMVKSVNRTVDLITGDPVDVSVFRNSSLLPDQLTKLLRKHVYSIGGGRKSRYFKTFRTVEHPQNRWVLKRELNSCELLQDFGDGKKSFVVTKSTSPSVIKEIGRLRELTFRKVGEGTGEKRDLDKFDTYYKHIVIWDDYSLEIIAACRLVILKPDDETVPYTSTLFEYSSLIKKKLGVIGEMGRSFVQPAYWNTNALDLMWKGIGTFLSTIPQIDHLVGAVSISGNMPKKAKDLIVAYYGKWYSSDVEGIISAKNGYCLTESSKETIFSDVLSGSNRTEDFHILKKVLKVMGYSVPVLLRHYSQLCSEKGMKVYDFCVDESFNSVDALISINISEIVASKKKRYNLDTSLPSEDSLQEAAGGN